MFGGLDRKVLQNNLVQKLKPSLYETSEVSQLSCVFKLSCQHQTPGQPHLCVRHPMTVLLKDNGSMENFKVQI